ncbi:BTB/POZ domain-containing protein DOT3 [Aristolochia californica]|uniref:BTB/POZ domain-containing protein DOT3 n=1 Tax=Aristolochia californica TaxID=171875 RepID=UPI0035DB0AA6
MASPGNQFYDLEHSTAHVYDRQIMIPRKDSIFAERFEKKDRSWFVSSQIPTDITVQIQDITFSFHKFPLQSRSGYMSRMNLHSPRSNYDYDVKMDNFPGGTETFELVLKFCYGISIDLTSTNVAPLRCAAEFLEMTEDLEEGNLISKTEAFITFAVVTSWRNSISVLKSCEPLSPWAENLQIIRRCSDSIGWKVSRDTHLTEEEDASDEQWWFDDVSTLKINYFVRIMKTIGAKGMADSIIGACIAYYAIKWLPGYDGDCEGQSPHVRLRNELQLSISSGWKQESRGGQNKEERMIIESLVSLLPPHREAVSCGFLLWLLKMAIVYSAAAALLTELEMRVGMVLEDATLDDLMIPNFPVADGWTSPDSAMKGCTMHNVDTVQRIVEYFLMHEQKYQQLPQQQTSAKIKVGKLLDGYLAEIATDPNLSPVKFQALADVLPGNARTYDDGLYRALDTYLKNHPSLTDHERRRLCRVMDNDKLSLDACFHAAQNERLPVRTVVQVLFTEQVKMKETMQRDAISKKDFSDQEGIWSATKQEVQNLKEEVEKMKDKVSELQQDYSFLHQEYDKLAKSSKNTTVWVPVWKKIRNSALFRRRRDEEEERGEMQSAERGRTLRRASVN